jgi:peptidoglycan/LPS O-acetylase OafA/YrhL
MYAIYPLLRPLLRKYPTTSLAVILVLSYTTAFPYNCHAIGGVPFFLPYLFPFALGAALSAHRLHPESSPALLRIPLFYLVLNSLAASVLILLGGSAFSPEAWYTYNFQYFFAVAVAILFIGFFSSHPLLSTLLSPLGRYSLWVFLLHYPLQSFVWEWSRFTNPRTSIVMALVLWAVSTLVAWALCLAASLIRKKSPRHPQPKMVCG